MGGTLAGGKKAATTNKQEYGSDFYHRIGAMGGAKGTTGGFAANRDLASAAGRVGGLTSRRGRRLTEAQRRRIKHQVVFNEAYEHLMAVREKHLRENA